MKPMFDYVPMESKRVGKNSDRKIKKFFFIVWSKNRLCSFHDLIYLLWYKFTQWSTERQIFPDVA